MNIRRNPETGRIIMQKPSLAWCEEVIQGDNSTGWCLACGSERDETEPDAERYECDACGMHHVYGAEQLVLMGRIAP